MTNKKTLEIREAKENEEDYVVPYLLGIVIRWSQLFLLAPVRLRCVSGRWAIIISPWLVMFQRIFLFFNISVVLLAFSLDIVLLQQHTSPHKEPLSTMLLVIQMVIPGVIISIRAWCSQWRIERNITLLQDIRKMKSTIKCRSLVTKTGKLQFFLLNSYILLKITGLMESAVRVAMIAINDNTLGDWASALPYPVAFYQNVVIVFFELELSFIIIEVRSAVSMINDELHSWLKTPDVKCIPHVRQSFVLHQKKKTNKVDISKPSLQVPNERPKASIGHLSDCYYKICELVWQINSDNGAFIVVNIMLLFIWWLCAAYNLIIAVGLADISKLTAEVLWCMLHFIKMFIIVEPGHRLQKELERTRRLVSKLAGVADRWDIDLAQLEPFLLQVQMKRDALVPMGMFTVSRPLVASIIGGIITTLTMIIQFRKISEHS